MKGSAYEHEKARGRGASEGPPVKTYASSKAAICGFFAEYQLIAG
jgi:hypothetical protein